MSGGAPFSHGALSLATVASWSADDDFPRTSTIRAGVPKLQRGLVWKTHQIEGLWDSILRGFPIGAITLSSVLQGQTKASDQKASLTHHILDGQQRCDAIGKGFRQPSGVDDPQGILWLDLVLNQPEVHDQKVFNLRFTNRAHPWGQSGNTEESKRLSFAQVRDCLELNHWLLPGTDDYIKPSPTNLVPKHRLTCPVPLAILIGAVNADRFLDRDYWPQFAGEAWYTDDFKARLKNLDSDLEKIEASIRRSLSFFEVAYIDLKLPKPDPKAGPDKLSPVQLLFRRINNAGTRISNEELAYSIVNTHFPELSEVIDRLGVLPVPAYRMASLGVRLALSRSPRQRDSGFPVFPSVHQIQSLALGSEEERGPVEAYFRTRLPKALEVVTRWLLIRDENDIGLPRVQITSLARESPEVYFLLFHLADLTIESGDPPEPLRKAILAMATVAGWLLGSKEHPALLTVMRNLRRPTSRTILEKTRDVLSEVKVSYEVSSGRQVTRSLELLSPEKFDRLLQKIRLEDPEWPKYPLFRGRPSALPWNRQVLLYAQRGYIWNRFDDFDPADQFLNGDQNRPWDYDHLCAGAYCKGKQGKFKVPLSFWIDTIANLRAWPAEDNRSDQKEGAESKIGSDPEKLRQSFLTRDELAGFSHGEMIRHRYENIDKFHQSCRRRMVRLYRQWYEPLGLEKLSVT